MPLQADPVFLPGVTIHALHTIPLGASHGQGGGDFGFERLVFCFVRVFGDVVLKCFPSLRRF